MTDNTQELDGILSQLMKDAITNRRADDPPQGRKMLLNEAKQALLDWHNKQVKDPFDYIEPCEPDCSPERHAYHQGQWDMAHRMADLELTTDKLKEAEL